MMRRSFALIVLTSLLASSFAAAPARAQDREEARLILARQVLQELRQSPDQFIPDRLLERAYGVAVVPNVLKGAFIFGVRRGQGVLVVRDNAGRFSNPVFVNLTGGSVGWQIGGQSSDVVLVFTTRAGIDGILKGKVTLGADASVAAGPVGRQASAGVDLNQGAEVYSYSRSNGLFAGIALDGTAITINHGSNAEYYGKPRVDPYQIVDGTVGTDKETARRFLAEVNLGTTPQSVQPVAGTAASPATPPPAAAPVTQPAAAEAARTFPMEDPKPGREPGT